MLNFAPLNILNVTVMKKIVMISACSLLLMSSCGTYTGQGAYVGGSFGSMIGSAIGGITGGWRGSDVGSLIGMAGGAAIGAAVGAAADRAQEQKYEDYMNARAQRRTHSQRQYEDKANSGYDNSAYDDSGFDKTNSGDDRLYGFGEDFSNAEDVNAPSTLEIRYAALEIRHARILDASRDGVLSRGEEARIVFEVFNTSTKPVYRIQPSVAEITGNRHIEVSDNVMIESIAPGQGIRYTALVRADGRLKDGEAVFRIGVFQGRHEIVSQTREFRIQTSKR
jgi:hypothetical protein